MEFEERLANRVDERIASIMATPVVQRGNKF
jgi:hypothetical protein